MSFDSRNSILPKLNVDASRAAGTRGQPPQVLGSAIPSLSRRADCYGATALTFPAMRLDAAALARAERELETLVATALAEIKTTKPVAYASAFERAHPWSGALDENSFHPEPSWTDRDFARSLVELKCVGIGSDQVELVIRPRIGSVGSMSRAVVEALAARLGAK